MTGKHFFERRIWSVNDDALRQFDCLKRADVRWCHIAVIVLSLAVSPAARAGTWDSLLSNSHWYVPQENLLAYMSSSTSFTTPPPLSLWDQTLWNLGTATEGRFTGSAKATFYISPENSFSSSDAILGIATESGQIRMRFTPSSGGSPVIGIGQFREVDGTTAMQMQMISGQAGEPYTSHWAAAHGAPRRITGLSCHASRNGSRPRNDGHRPGDQALLERSVRGQVGEFRGSLQESLGDGRSDSIRRPE